MFLIDINFFIIILIVQKHLNFSNKVIRYIKYKYYCNYFGLSLWWMPVYSCKAAKNTG